MALITPTTAAAGAEALRLAFACRAPLRVIDRPAPGCGCGETRLCPEVRVVSLEDCVRCRAAARPIQQSGP